TLVPYTTLFRSASSSSRNAFGVTSSPQKDSSSMGPSRRRTRPPASFLIQFQNLFIGSFSFLFSSAYSHSAGFHCLAGLPAALPGLRVFPPRPVPLLARSVECWPVPRLRTFRHP